MTTRSRSSRHLPANKPATEKEVRRGFDPFERARKHPIVRDLPSPDFFEGALLGNGGLGVVVCTRPDAVVLRFGHNNVWDIRIAEENRDKLGTFQEVFERVKAIPSTHKSLTEDPWYAEYLKMCRENYAKPYPRPFRCGSVILGFDRRKVELLGHRLDIANGLCVVRFLVDGKEARLELFADMEADRVWLRAGNVPFNRIRLLPDAETPKELPAFTALEGALGFRQVLPFEEKPGGAHPKDRAFRLSARVNASLEAQTRTNTVNGLPETMGGLERGIVSEGEFVACVHLEEGLAKDVPVRRAADSKNGGNRPPLRQQFKEAARRSQQTWREFWNRSGVALDDPILERTWYQNLYFLNCAVKPGVACPGLFANWSFGKIGTAWHGDYHLDYNAQQPFWVTFSSNHVEKNLAYTAMVEHLLPVCRSWARDYYQMRGACFPVSAYPVEMNLCPYPLPTWGWQMCVTPWAVQNLWWHYLYTMDRDYLERRAFGPIKEVVLFLVDYLKRPEVHGPQWGDDRFHIFPTVPSELYGLRPGFQYNSDCLIDVTLTRFVFRAYLHACFVLGLDKTEAPLTTEVSDILQHLPDYPTTDSERGKVFVSVTGEHPDIVFNVPASLMTVFPGEEHGLHTPSAQSEIAANTYRNQRNEGGTELVFLNFIGARLGLLDLERFKREIEYNRFPNGACTDRILEAQGRYTDTTDFDYGARMGIWFENFALPAVINECLMQSVGSVIRLFPNWPASRRAQFQTLRAVGGFLVSAATGIGGIEWIEIRSEAGERLRLLNPWTGKVGEVKTRPGQILTFAPPRASQG